MATWKKVIVSGSSNSQLANDENYLIQGQSGAILTGSFTGSFAGDGAGLINVPATGIVLSELSDGNGVVDFTYNGQSAASVTVDADGTTLTVGASGVKVSTDGITNIEIASNAVNNDSIANDSILVAQLSSSAVVTEAEGIGNNDNDTTIPTSAAVKDYVDNNVTAQDLDGAADDGTFTVDLDSQTFTVAGGAGIETTGSGQTVTVKIGGASVTNDMLAGSIANAKLTNSTMTIGSQSVALGGSITTFSGSFLGDGSGLTNVPASGINLADLTDGNGIVDFTYDGNSTASVTVEADGTTLTVGASGVKVTDAGITATQLNTSVAGTGLSGGAGTALSVDYGSLVNTAAQGNVTIEVAGTTNEIEITGGGSAAIGTSRTITVGLPDDVTISGDLTVLGTASFQDTVNLAIADRFILLASGSNAAGDGGIVVQQTTQDVGDVFAYENSVTRWGIGTSFNATASAYTPDAFMAAAINTAGNDPNGGDAPAARYNKKGNLYVASNSEDIWIYS
jgi:hypothetical protein|tara:strand:- start:2229 stop:3755 length:1527 start_codon:yes stop_codon:yes gene_type:complete